MGWLGNTIIFFEHLAVLFHLFCLFFFFFLHIDYSKCFLYLKINDCIIREGWSNFNIDQETILSSRFRAASFGNNDLLPTWRDRHFRHSHQCLFENLLESLLTEALYILMLKQKKARVIQPWVTFSGTLIQTHHNNGRLKIADLCNKRLSKENPVSCFVITKEKKKQFARFY